MLHRSDICGRRIISILESQDSEQIAIEYMGAAENWCYYKWYLGMDDLSVIFLESAHATLLQQPPETTNRARVNATRIVPGEVYFQNASLVSDAVRARVISETPLARQHLFLTEDATEELVVGREITEVLLAKNEIMGDRLILLLDGQFHLSVWMQDYGNLLQFDTLDEVLDRDDDSYQRYFDGVMCNAFGQAVRK